MTNVELIPALRICKHCTVIKPNDQHGEKCENCNGHDEIIAWVLETDAEIIEDGGIGN